MSTQENIRAAMEDKITTLKSDILQFLGKDLLLCHKTISKKFLFTVDKETETCSLDDIMKIIATDSNEFNQMKKSLVEKAMDLNETYTKETQNRYTQTIQINTEEAIPAKIKRAYFEDIYGKKQKERHCVDYEIFNILNEPVKNRMCTIGDTGIFIEKEEGTSFISIIARFESTNK